MAAGRLPPSGPEEEQDSASTPQAGPAFPAPTGACPQSRPSPSCARTFRLKAGNGPPDTLDHSGCKAGPTAEMGAAGIGLAGPHTQPAWEASLPQAATQPLAQSRQGTWRDPWEAPLLGAVGCPQPSFHEGGAGGAEQLTRLPPTSRRAGFPRPCLCSLSLPHLGACTEHDCVPAPPLVNPSQQQPPALPCRDTGIQPDLGR